MQHRVTLPGAQYESPWRIDVLVDARSAHDGVAAQSQWRRTILFRRGSSHCGATTTYATALTTARAPSPCGTVGLAEGAGYRQFEAFTVYSFAAAR